ncbi:MAG: hypothetical protein GF350_03940 [Chitinivibrionales bacterium]|nr:hypothetical protein [Chitinivibrionales bacterium]
MNSSKNERENRLKRARSRSSFFARNKKPNPRGFLKIIILITIITLLTWYAKQGRNNPLLFDKKLVLAGSAGAIYLASVHSPGSASIILLSPPTSGDTLSLPFDSISVISASLADSGKMTIRPEPLHRITLAPLSDSTAWNPEKSPSLPSSYYTFSSGGLIRIIAPAQKARCLLAELHKLRILICNRFFTVEDTAAIDALRENIDILVYTGPAGPEIRRLRTLFRPRKVIAFSPGMPVSEKESGTTFFRPENPAFQFRIRKNAMNKIEISELQPRNSVR